MSRHGHDGSGAIADEDVVSDPDGDLLTADRISRVAAGEDAALGLGEFRAVEVALERRLLAVLIDRRALLRSRQPIHRRMLRREDHVRHAEQRVGASRVDAEHVVARFAREAGLGAGGFPIDDVFVGRPSLADADADGLGRPSYGADEEIDLGSFAAADPVALHVLDRLGPTEVFQLIREPVAVGRDAEQPLAERQAFDGVAAAIALAVDDLFVGEHRAETGAPVDRSLMLIRQPLLVLIPPHRRLTLRGDIRRDQQLGDWPPSADALLSIRPDPRTFSVVPSVEQHQKNPLRPAVVIGIGRGQLAVPVVAEAERL